MSLSRDDIVYLKATLKKILKQAKDNEIKISFSPKLNCINFESNGEIGSVYLEKEGVEIEK